MTDARMVCVGALLLFVLEASAFTALPRPGPGARLPQRALPRVQSFSFDKLPFDLGALLQGGGKEPPPKLEPVGFPVGLCLACTMTCAPQSAGVDH